jgi:hypothetical protein
MLASNIHNKNITHGSRKSLIIKFLAKQLILCCCIIHTHSRLDPELTYKWTTWPSQHPSPSYRKSEPLRSDTKLGKIPERWVRKHLSESTHGILNSIFRNIYQHVKENYYKSRRSYSITRPNKKPSTSKIQINGITAELGRQVDNIPECRTYIQSGKDWFPPDPFQLYL